jgi:hypothetical protein
MLSLRNMSNTPSIETIVRQALALGELSPGAEAAIDQARSQGALTAKDRRVLEILTDAIANNCIQRVGREHSRL